MILWDQTLLKLFQKGGFTMWPLLLCSILAAAVIVERAIFFQLLRLHYDRFLEELKGLLSKRRYKEAREFCGRRGHPVCRIAAVYLDHLGNDRLRADVLKREGSYALEKVETRLRVLGALTHIAPLLGLLGTVTGLVGAFHRIELLSGQVQAGDLAAGIWEALITTVFGLVIAIPSMAAYHVFEAAADKVARHMKFIISELDGVFGKETETGFRVTDPEKVEESMKAVQ